MGFDLAMQVKGFFGNTGKPLSNTSIIYPKVKDNLGKLSLNLDRKDILQ